MIVSGSEVGAAGDHSNEAERHRSGAAGMNRTGLEGQRPGDSVWETIYVPNWSVGLIIGKNGANIKSLEEKSGARISRSKVQQAIGSIVNDSDHQPLTISGSPDSIVQAKTSIQRIVDSKVRSSAYLPLSVFLSCVSTSSICFCQCATTL